MATIHQRSGSARVYLPQRNICNFATYLSVAPLSPPQEPLTALGLRPKIIARAKLRSLYNLCFGLEFRTPNQDNCLRRWCHRRKDVHVTDGRTTYCSNILHVKRQQSYRIWRTAQRVNLGRFVWSYKKSPKGVAPGQLATFRLWAMPVFNMHLVLFIVLIVDFQRL